MELKPADARRLTQINYGSLINCASNRKGSRKVGAYKPLRALHLISLGGWGVQAPNPGLTMGYLGQEPEFDGHLGLLSGGQKKLLGLAQLLVARPDLLLQLGINNPFRCEF